MYHHLKSDLNIGVPELALPNRCEEEEDDTNNDDDDEGVEVLAAR